MGSTLVPPSESELACRLSHLEEANRVRVARAHLLRRMGELAGAESCAMAAEVVVDPPEVLRSLSVGAFLRRVRRVGGAVALQMLGAGRVPEQTRLGDLTLRQRAALEGLLRCRAERALR